MILTTSRRSAFRLCARLHDVRYVRRYRPAQEPTALVLGTAVHAALEAHWRVLPLPVHPDPYIDARVRVMVEGYDAKWPGDVHRYHLLAAEKRFEHALLDPVLFTASDRWTCGGKIDAIVRDRTTGATLVIEHKTTSFDVGPSSPFWERQTMDDQCSTYVLGAEALGYEVDRILYDVLRKPPDPITATPIEKRRYRKAKKGEEHLAPDDEQLLYKNQRAHDETPAEYEARIRELVFEDLDAWYARREVPRIEGQIRAHMEDAWADALRMQHAQDNHLAPRNPDACFRYGRCWLWDHCAQGEDLDSNPDRYVRSGVAHPELEEHHESAL